MWRIRRMITSLPARCGGLLSQGASSPTEDIPDTGWRAGEVRVVDLAGLSPEVQGVALARTVERMLTAAENSTLGVDHLVIMVDELNQWAPSQGGELAAVRRVLQRVVTQGRYAGVSLWGAAQKPSKVDELVRDNCATRVLGRTSDGELSSGTYGRLPNGLAERIATLERGQALVWHPTFRTPQLVRFPRPAWQTGRPVGDDRVRRTTMDTVGDLSATARRRLTSGLSDDAVEAIVAGADDPSKALEALDRARTIDPHDVHLTADRSNLLDPDDPFDLG
jgi:DNA helicase HerA-like ATPase